MRPNKNSEAGMIAKNLSDSKMTEKTIPTVVNIASNELKPRT